MKHAFSRMRHIIHLLAYVVCKLGKAIKALYDNIFTMSKGGHNDDHE